MAVRAAAVCLFKSTAAPPATYISAAPTSGYRPRRCTLRASRRRTSRSHKLSLTSLSPPPLPTPPAGPAAGPAAALLALVLVTITPPPPAAAATTSRARRVVLEGAPSGGRRPLCRAAAPAAPANGWAAAAAAPDSAGARWGGAVSPSPRAAAKSASRPPLPPMRRRGRTPFCRPHVLDSGLRRRGDRQRLAHSAVRMSAPRLPLFCRASCSAHSPVKLGCDSPQPADMCNLCT